MPPYHLCKQCDRDTTEVVSHDDTSLVKYFCKACKQEFSIDFRKEEGVKLLWRVDWPMRWSKEQVDFEPGGKDHSSQGGSYDTGCEIVREIWKREPPFYVQYDFVLAKGVGSKLSSSSGNLITLTEALEIYEPALVRYLFASRKPNLDFSIAFDLDVMKAYDDFDRCERFAFGLEKGEDKKVNYEKRIYEKKASKSPTKLCYLMRCAGPDCRLRHRAALWLCAANASFRFSAVPETFRKSRNTKKNS
ncbi:MAG: lysine--tRNA ligase [Proteobacteria bacterium]|nr:lysine--tRNA ligase [Pseudomonadota bacterium]